MTRTRLLDQKMSNNKQRTNDKHQIAGQKVQEATFERCALKIKT